MELENDHRCRHLRAGVSGGDEGLRFPFALQTQSNDHRAVGFVADRDTRFVSHFDDVRCFNNLDPIASHAHNVDAFLNVLSAAKEAGVGRLVYASSSSVYGDHPGLPKHEDRIGKPLSPYAATKRADELYAQVFHDVYGQQVIGLRYFNVFGRRQDPEGPYAAVIPRWIAALLDGKPCVIFGDGSNSRDFCYVDNIVQANLLAATAPDPAVTGTVYNCGCNGRTDLKQLFAMIRDNLAKKFPEIASAEPVFEGPRAGDVAHS